MQNKSQTKLYINRLVLFVSIVIMLNVIYLSTTYAQENPRIYWTWHVETMERGRTYQIDIDYVTKENVNCNLREGIKNSITVPDCCIGKKIVVGLEPATNAFKILGPSEFTLQPSMNDFHKSWDVQPIEKGEWKEIKFKYRYESERDCGNDVCYINVIDYVYG